MATDQVTLKLRGMSCAACASNVEQAIRSVPGVTDCSVNFGAEQAHIIYDSQQTDLDDIQQAVSEAGYSASPQEADVLTGEVDTERAARLAEHHTLTRKVWVGGIISAILMIGGLPMMTGLHLPWIPTWLHNFWFQAVLTAPVLFWCGQQFLSTAGRHSNATTPRWIR